jgi:hypothetical protein
MTWRAALMVVALVVGCLGLPSTGALAASTTTTLPKAIVAAGNAYALHLLNEQPVPPEARAVTSLPSPIAPSDGFAFAQVERSHRFYLLPPSVSVMSYVRAHLPEGETNGGTGTSYGPGTKTVYYLSVARTCVSRHILYCGISYTSTELKDGQQELRVDAEVVYLPILHVKMPTDGVVTVTGYGKAGIQGSSDPSSVVLSHSEALRLRSAISGMKDMGDNGMCMEGSMILRIKVVKDGKVVWRAVADDCPGALVITSAKSNQILDNRSCSFWHVVDSFFASNQVSATKGESLICSQSQFDD